MESSLRFSEKKKEGEKDWLNSPRLSPRQSTKQKFKKDSLGLIVGLIAEGELYKPEEITVKPYILPSEKTLGYVLVGYDKNLSLSYQERTNALTYERDYENYGRDPKTYHLEKTAEGICTLIPNFKLIPNFENTFPDRPVPDIKNVELLSEKYEFAIVIHEGKLQLRIGVNGSHLYIANKPYAVMAGTIYFTGEMLENKKIKHPKIKSITDDSGGFHLTTRATANKEPVPSDVIELYQQSVKRAMEAIGLPLDKFELFQVPENKLALTN